MKKMIIGVMFSFLATSSVFASDLKILKCDTVVVAVKNPNQSDQEVIQLSPLKLKNVTVLDAGNQFQLLTPNGKMTSPMLRTVREGIQSALGVSQDGHKAMFIKRDGEYQVTSDGVQYLLMKNCVDATSLI